MSIPMQRYPIFDVSTPLRDLIFYEVVDFNIRSNRDMAYGTPHHNVPVYPNHELVYITPNDKEAKTYRFYYAAKRENQDDYNWEIQTGEQLTRTYVIKRELYFERSSLEAEVVDEFTYPAIGTPDIRFPKYGFADDSVMQSNQEITSLYVFVKRRFIEPITSELAWDDDLERYVLITKEIIPAEVYPTPPVRIAGYTSEVKQGNTFFDARITKQVIGESNEIGDEQTYPYELAPIPRSINQPFPAKLNSIDLVTAWAWAVSTYAAPAYDSAHYWRWNIVSARPGPYSATSRRFITDDPETIQLLYPIDIIPKPVRDVIGLVYSWWSAGVLGNVAVAHASEIEVPSTIHDEIIVAENLEPDGPTDAELKKAYTETLDATPGYAEFMAKIENGTVILDHVTQKMPMGLYMVEVIEVNIENLYG